MNTLKATLITVAPGRVEIALSPTPFRVATLFPS